MNSNTKSKESQQFKSVKEVRKYFRDMEKNKNIFVKIYEKIDRFFYRIFDYIYHLPKEIKWFIQRGKRGFGDNDVWDLNDYLGHIVIEGIKKLKKIQHGHPDGFNRKEWHKMLNKIIYTFTLEQKGYKLTPKQQEKCDEGWEVFKKYFGYLWD